MEFLQKILLAYCSEIYHNLAKDRGIGIDKDLKM
jgi:hypothetical protein